MNKGRNVELAVAVTRDGRPQYLIAAKAHLHPSRFSAILHGRVSPSASERQRIAAALRVDPAEVFGELAMA